MRDFKVGDQIRYGAYSNDGAPIWNVWTRRTALNVEIIFKYGVVMTADKDEFSVHFGYNPKCTWAWPQPSTNKVPVELWEDPNYIQLVEVSEEQPDPEVVQIEEERDELKTELAQVRELSTDMITVKETMQRAYNDKCMEVKALKEERDQWRDQAKTLQVTNSKIKIKIQGLRMVVKRDRAWWNCDCERYTEKIKALEDTRAKLLSELEAAKTRLDAVTVNQKCCDRDYVFLKEGLVASQADLASAEKVLVICEDEIKKGKKRLKKALSLLGLR